MKSLPVSHLPADRRSVDRGPQPELLLREERIELSAPSLLFAALRAALVAEGLPVEDLQQPGRLFYAYFSNRDTLAGFGGFESHGDHALVRSIVVLPGHRGQGLARQIVPRVLARATEAGARRAWLLTDSAQQVFSRLGFSIADRAAVPSEITSTSQFSQLCGDDAILMHRPLEPELAQTQP